MVVQVAQVLDAFAVEPLCLVDDDQPRLVVGERLDELVRQLEAVASSRRQRADDAAREMLGDVQHRRAAGELHVDPCDLKIAAGERCRECLA